MSHGGGDNSAFGNHGRRREKGLRESAGRTARPRPGAVMLLQPVPVPWVGEDPAEPIERHGARAVEGGGVIIQ